MLVASGVPNDPSFGLQWALQNTGQTVTGDSGTVTGTAGADEDVVPAWGVTTGSRSVVVAVTDTGVDYNDLDLAANVWSNPGGVGGCAAGTHGFDVLSGESACVPMDTDTVYGGHGTHVAGIIGAVGDNGVGVTGVNWTTSIMAVKWLDSESSGLTSDLINALAMVVTAKQAGVNVRVVNDSSTFPGVASSQALSDEIDVLGDNNILFVTAAGNSSEDNDITPRYPCNYDLANEICVAATDQNDQLPSWANWGPNTVDLAAPGVNIYSTLIGGYGYISGASMSAAEVSGAAALILSADDNLTATQLKADILNNVHQLSALATKVRSGGILDVWNAVKAVAAPANTTPPVISGSAQVGQTLTTGNGTWSGVSASYSYQWQRCDTSGGSCSAISGQTGQIYTVSGADVGDTLEAVVTATNAAGSAAATTPVTATVPVPPPPPVTSSPPATSTTPSTSPSSSSKPALVAAPGILTRPAISGRLRVHARLTAADGSWTGSPTHFTYQWRRCNRRGRKCTAIAGAISKSFTVVGSDVGKKLEVTVTASNAGGSNSATSYRTVTVSAAAAGASSHHKRSRERRGTRHFAWWRSQRLRDSVA